MIGQLAARRQPELGSDKPLDSPQIKVKRFCARVLAGGKVCCIGRFDNAREAAMMHDGVMQVVGQGYSKFNFEKHLCCLSDSHMRQSGCLFEQASLQTVKNLTFIHRDRSCKYRGSVELANDAVKVGACKQNGSQLFARHCVVFAKHCLQQQVTVTHSVAHSCQSMAAAAWC